MTQEEKKLPEGLEEAAKKFVGYDMDTDNLRDYEVGIEAFKAGAEWQKVQDQKTIELAEEHAMLAGMNKMEQQMLEGAVEGKVIKSYNPAINAGEPSLHGIEIIYPDKDKPYLIAGDRVRIIVIKEDEK